MDIDLSALRFLAQEREIAFEVLIPVIEKALVLAYEKTDTGRKARVEIDPKSGKAIVWAREEISSGEYGPEFDDTPKNFGRVATATARQVILQKLQEAEDEQVLGQFSSKEGQIISGVIQQGRDPKSVFIDVGDLEVKLPEHEQVYREAYTHGERLRVYVLKVSRGFNGPQIEVSRTHPNLVKKLFELEVPEIADGSVEIVAIAREAGYRTKIAVKSNIPGLNAKGACIGPLGQRVRAVMSELQDEKIDIVDYSDDPAKFIASALSPAKVTAVTDVDPVQKSAKVSVPEYQLSLAIGKEGQNARLAARLTGWKIDISAVPDAIAQASAE